MATVRTLEELDPQTLRLGMRGLLKLAGGHVHLTADDIDPSVAGGEFTISFNDDGTFELNETCTSGHTPDGAAAWRDQVCTLCGTVTRPADPTQGPKHTRT